jgi:integrase
VKELMDLLREHRQTLAEDAFFIFPTKPAKGSAGRFKKGGKQMLNMLDLLKLDYFRAGLNCGTCEVVRKGKPVSCAGVPQCFRAGLHMFRHTYATNHLRAGFSLPDVSRLLGHQDVHTTQIYLHSLDNEDIREQMLGTGLGSMYTPDAFKPVEYKRIHVVSDEARKRMSEGGKRSGSVKAVAAVL